MANNLESNVTRKLARVFLEAWESDIVLCKTVDMQLLSGKFNPASGRTVDFKRQHDFKTMRTATGDISALTKSDIVAGKATGTVQDYFTEALEWDEVEEALELDQLEPITKRIMDRMCVDLELDFGRYMQANAALTYGTVGSAVDAWSDVAGAGAHAEALGVPSDDLCYVMNPFTQVALADTQASLASGKGSLVNSAWEKAQISQDFGGLNVLKSNALKTRTAAATGGDRVGAVNGTPAATYVAHKDTMIQSIEVDGFTGGFTIPAGEVIEITGRFRRALNTREVAVDAQGNRIPWRGTVVSDAVIAGGAGTLLVAGPAIFEANGQYNTAETAIADNDVVTLLGSDSDLYQPNLFYHKQAFGMGFVKLKKLYSTDTVAWTKDGFSMRVSKYADGDANKQMMRVDMLPAYATFNPMYAGQAYGT